MHVNQCSLVDIVQLLVGLIGNDGALDIVLQQKVGIPKSISNADSALGEVAKPQLVRTRQLL